MKGALLVAGTSSDAGKSVVVTGICRWLARHGVGVAPFKAQNMALNSAVTPDGAEIGRAQFAQAQAARVVPEAAMNPILLKPTSDRGSQVVVLGQPWTEVDAIDYLDLRSRLRPVVLEALASLRSRFDVVVCEGAGSLAEINLREGDLVNMGLAREAGLPVVVVADIDRGGAFASLFGSLALLTDEDQALVGGFLLNKFRGDPSLLEPAIEELERRTDRRVLGVLPWVSGLRLDEEDSLALQPPPTEFDPPLGRDALSVAVVRLPHLSNFTDLDALGAEPGVVVRFTDSPSELAAADLVVLPGTKATVEDLRWLRSRKLDEILRDRAARQGPLMGICGGYQLLGRRIVDAVESKTGDVEALGLLPVETVFEPDKILGNPSGTAPAFGDTEVRGYEIHHGRVRPVGGEPLFATPGGAEGCRVGAVLGTSWHGVFENDAFRRAFLRWVAEVRGLDWVPGSRPFAAIREARFDLLGDLIEDHVDTSLLRRLIEGGLPADPRVVRSGLEATTRQGPRSVRGRAASLGPASAGRETLGGPGVLGGRETLGGREGLGGPDALAGPGALGSPTPPLDAHSRRPNRHLRTLRSHGDRMVPPGYVNFAVNVWPRRPPEWLREKLAASLERVSSYPDDAEATAALAERHGRQPEEVLPLNGAAEAFWLLAAVLRPRRAVVVHPTFTEPEAALHAHGRPVVRAFRDPKTFAFDPAAVPDDADLVVVGNPNNPTGNLEPARAIVALARPGRVLVVDESFMEFCPGEPESLAARPDLPGLVVVRSLTKLWSLPGLRAGYLLAPPDLVARLRDLRQPWPVSVPALTAMVACTQAVDEVRKRAEEVAAAREALAAGLAELPGLQVWPSAANFLLVRARDGAKLRRALLARRLAVRPAETFPGLTANHLRIAVRGPEDNERLLEAMREVLG